MINEKRYPGVAVYFSKDDAPVLERLERVAMERGMSASFFSRRCLEMGLQLCEQPKNKNALRPTGTVTLDLTRDNAHTAPKTKKK